MDILYGRNPVVEALRAQRPARKIVVAIGLSMDARLREIYQLAEQQDIPIEETSRQRLFDIAHNEHHQGVVGYFHARVPFTLKELLAEIPDPALLLILDGVQDPHNLGALMRTAEGAGVDGVVIPRHRSVSVTPTVAKSAAGASEYVRFCVVPNLAVALDTLGEQGFSRVGLDAGAPQRYDEHAYTLSTALVVGSEGQGMRDLTKRRCDTLVRIPMVGKVASLNAAVAGAILMYEASRQRGFPRRSSQ